MNVKKFKKANRKGPFSMHFVPRNPQQWKQWNKGNGLGKSQHNSTDFIQIRLIS